MLWLRRALVLGLLALPLGAALSACKQGVGERCQLQTDCDDGLTCVLPSGASVQQGGTCQAPGMVPDLATATPDDFAQPSPDLVTSPTDGGEHD